VTTTDLSEIIERTTIAAGEEWRAKATEIVEELALTRPTFTADDVWLAGLEKPAEGRALGGVMRAARAAGLIASTGRYVPSIIPTNHSKPQAVWSSLVAVQEVAA
jgi:hypothetical protein